MLSAGTLSWYVCKQGWWRHGYNYEQDGGKHTSKQTKRIALTMMYSRVDFRVRPTVVTHHILLPRNLFRIMEMFITSICGFPLTHPLAFRAKMNKRGKFYSAYQDKTIIILSLNYIRMPAGLQSKTASIQCQLRKRHSSAFHSAAPPNQERDNKRSQFKT